MRAPHRLILALLLVAPAAAASTICQPPSPSGPDAATRSSIVAELPFELNSNKVYLKVTVNGIADQPLVLDTGSPGSCLDTELTARLGLATRDPHQTEGAGNKSIGAATAGGVVLRLGGLELPARDVQVIPLNAAMAHYEGRPLAGMVGGDIFAEYVVEIDYAASKVRLHDRSRFAYDGPGTTVPLTVRAWPFVHARLKFPGRAEIGGEFLVDCGARLPVTLSTAMVNREHLLGEDVKSVVLTVAAGLGGEMQHHVTRLESAALGDASLDGVVATLSQDTGGVFGDPRIDGLVGAEYLRRFRVFFDYGGQRLILERRTDPGAPQVMHTDASGLFLTAQGADLQTITVLSVGKESPASDSGLLPGDVIERADGHAAMNLETVRRLLQEPGHQVELVLRRAGQLVDVRLVTRALI